MKKETLGAILKQRRDELALTQRELARRLGIKASHIAYLESGQRRPSLALLARLAKTLDLGQQRLFLLAHPEAEAMVGAGRPRSRAHEDSWRNFAANRALLERHKVTPREMRVLSQVNTLGRVSAPRHFLFILNSIRQSMDQD